MTERTKKFRLLLASTGGFLLLLGGLLILHAQTVTSKLQWTQPLTTGQTFADVQAFVYTLQIDALAPAVVTATCVAGPPIICTTPLGPFVTSGTHTLTLTASNGFGSVSATLTGAPPQAPATAKVVITVTVP
jgi:hypothetical protein